MAYVKQTWEDGELGETPITAERLNHMEDGIETADLPTPLKWTSETRATDAGVRATGYNGASIGVTVPYTGTLTRAQLRFGSSDATGSTTVQLRLDGVATGMPILTMTAPGISQVWVGSIIVTQGQVLTAEVLTLGGTPGTGMAIAYAGTIG